MKSRASFSALAVLALLGCGNDETSSNGPLAAAGGGGAGLGGVGGVGGIAGGASGGPSGGALGTGASGGAGGLNAGGNASSGGSSASGGRGGASGGGSGGMSGLRPVRPACEPATPRDTACPVCKVETGCASPTYTSNPDGTATSSCCGLVWQSAVGKDNVNWLAAHDYCAALTLAGGGWRLPTIRELQTLMVGTTYPAIDTKVFPDTPIGDFWSSDGYTFANAAWVATYYDGSVMGGDLSNSESFVRCVR